jgi:excisionase family DNA binding protein
MMITEQKFSFFIVIHRLKLDCFTQFSVILKVIGETLMLTNDEPAMTVRDVAACLNVDEKTIYRLVTKGELPGFKVLGSWRFQRSDLEAWIESRKLKPKS